MSDSIDERDRSAIEQARRQIDRIDGEIVGLLSERAEHVRAIGDAKHRLGVARDRPLAVASFSEFWMPVSATIPTSVRMNTATNSAMPCSRLRAGVVRFVMLSFLTKSFGERRRR